VVGKVTSQEKVKPGDFHSSVAAMALSPDNRWVAAAVGPRPNRGVWLVLGRGQGPRAILGKLHRLARSTVAR
jgi:hypothetical protein